MKRQNVILVKIVIIKVQTFCYLNSVLLKAFLLRKPKRLSVNNGLAYRIRDTVNQRNSIAQNSGSVQINHFPLCIEHSVLLSNSAIISIKLHIYVHKSVSNLCRIFFAQFLPKMSSFIIKDV